MIPIIYTDSDRVLGTLGLSSEDIEDSFFQTKDMPRKLSVDLFTWLPDHTTHYVEPGTLDPLPADQFKSDCLVLYCTYFCANKVLEGVMGVMAKESDGQNEYNRLSSLDIPALIKEVQAQAGHYRFHLLAAIAPETPSNRVTQSAVVAPSYDPVSG